MHIITGCDVIGATSQSRNRFKILTIKRHLFVRDQPAHTTPKARSRTRLWTFRSLVFLMPDTNSICFVRYFSKFSVVCLKGRTPLDLSFWSFLTFLTHGIEKIERHLLWKLHKKIQRKRWSNMPPKLLACIRLLYKVVDKIGRLWKFNRAREIEFNFFIAWTIFMKLGTLVHHVHGYKMLPQVFKFLPKDLIIVFQSQRNGAKLSLNFERS